MYEVDGWVDMIKENIYLVTELNFEIFLMYIFTLTTSVFLMSILLNYSHIRNFEFQFYKDF